MLIFNGICHSPQQCKIISRVERVPAFALADYQTLWSYFWHTKPPKINKYFFLEKSQIENSQIWNFSKFSRSKKSFFSKGNSMKIEIFENLKKRKIRFSLDFLWKMFPFFRSRKFRNFSDLRIFDLRFLQEKIFFYFRVFFTWKVCPKCLIISQRECRHAFHVKMILH